MVARCFLDRIYRQYNRRRFVHPDPVGFLYRYPDIRDRELVGLIASVLAYGRVAQIHASVESVLKRIGPAPHDFIQGASYRDLERAMAGFRHRFTTGGDMGCLLAGMRQAIRCHGSLHACFQAGFRPADETVEAAMDHFIDALGCGVGYLLPAPRDGSACKRFHLYLRWMVRKDAIDPGGWDAIPRQALMVPLDVHMARMAVRFGFTRRRSVNGAMVREVTGAFRRLNPSDPVKYDFALTRFGIRAELAGERDRLPRAGNQKECSSDGKTPASTSRR